MEVFMKKLSLIVLIALGIAFTHESTAQVFDSPPRDGVYDKITIPNREAVQYPYLREADVFWSKRIWRVIDMREKINHPFYYPVIPINDRRSLMQVIYDAVLEGAVTAYEATSDEFLIPMTPEQVFANLNDTIEEQLQRLEPPFDWYDTIYVIEFEPSDVRQFRLKEDWFFDKQRSVMDVRILGICPIVESIDPTTGESRGTVPLFWIYFPEARPLFATVEIFNRHNRSERRSLDDIFAKRMFGSYIYKEDNVYDRFISDYARGLDALLESERIKNEIFLLEHDLWEY